MYFTKGDLVRVIDRVETHKDKHLYLIGRIGVIQGPLSRKGFYPVQLHSVMHPNKLIKEAYYYPQELEKV